MAYFPEERPVHATVSAEVLEESLAVLRQAGEYAIGEGVAREMTRTNPVTNEVTSYGFIAARNVTSEGAEYRTPYLLVFPRTGRIVEVMAPTRDQKDPVTGRKYSTDDFLAVVLPNEEALNVDIDDSDVDEGQTLEQAIEEALIALAEHDDDDYPFDTANPERLDETLEDAGTMLENLPALVRERKERLDREADRRWEQAQAELNAHPEGMVRLAKTGREALRAAGVLPPVAAQADTSPEPTGTESVPAEYAHWGDTDNGTGSDADEGVVDMDLVDDEDEAETNKHAAVVASAE